MNGLVAFLTARLDEAEARARAATGAPWWYDPAKCWRNPDRPFSGDQEAVFAGPRGDRAVTVATTGDSDHPQSMADARFIAGNGPSVVLADIAAKRSILDGYKMLTWVLGDDEAPMTLKDREFVLRGVLKRLATVYATHPDYDEAWKP